MEHSTSGRWMVRRSVSIPHGIGPRRTSEMLRRRGVPALLCLGVVSACGSLTTPSPASFSLQRHMSLGGWTVLATAVSSSGLVAILGDPPTRTGVTIGTITNETLKPLVLGGRSPTEVAWSRTNSELWFAYRAGGIGVRLADVNVATGAVTDLEAELPNDSSFDSGGLALSPDGKKAVVGVVAGAQDVPSVVKTELVEVDLSSGVVSPLLTGSTYSAGTPCFAGPATVVYEYADSAARQVRALDLTTMKQQTLLGPDASLFQLTCDLSGGIVLTHSIDREDVEYLSLKSRSPSIVAKGQFAAPALFKGSVFCVNADSGELTVFSRGQLG